LFAQAGGRPDRSGGVGRGEGDRDGEAVGTAVGEGDAVGAGEGSATGGGALQEAASSASAASERSHLTARGYSATRPEVPPEGGRSPTIRMGKERGGLSAAPLEVATPEPSARYATRVKLMSVGFGLIRLPLVSVTPLTWNWFAPAGAFAVSTSVTIVPVESTEAVPLTAAPFSV